MLQSRLISIKEEIISLLAFFLQQNPLILGLGNPLKTDDAFGLVACEELNHIGVKCVKCEYGIESCISEIEEKDAKTILIIDAVISQDDPPGTLIIVEEDSLASEKYLFTTHTLPLKTILDFLKKESNIDKVLVIGVTPYSLDYGLELTSEMKASLEIFIEIFREALARISRRG